MLNQPPLPPPTNNKVRLTTATLIFSLNTSSLFLPLYSLKDRKSRTKWATSREAARRQNHSRPVTHAIQQATNIAAAVGGGGGAETVIGTSDQVLVWWKGKHQGNWKKKEGKTEIEKRPIHTRQLTPVNLGIDDLWFSTSRWCTNVTSYTIKISLKNFLFLNRFDS